MDIKPLWAPDISTDFLETLIALSVVDLSIDEAKQVFQDRLRQGIRTVIAVENGKVVGTASLLVERKFLHKGGKAGHIEDVAVHPNYQRRGIGKALVMHLVEEAQKRSCYKVILDCKDELVVFYEKCGFKRGQCQMRFDCM
jgi:glucosamine-phosphate N-acetyltransferase